MKIKLPNPEEFYIKDVTIAGVECILVHPKSIAVKWTEENKIFRSSIWTKKDLLPVSLGFRKFTNYGEQPDFEPLLFNKPQQFIQKIDGTCLILSKFRGELIARTRGTADLTKQPNGAELELLKEKYPKLFNAVLETHSTICEWTTPSNIIVLRESEEPELRLIGVIDHHLYRYCPQNLLDSFAEIWNVPRPKTYDFNTFEEMKAAVEQFEGVEGVVIYGNEGQVLKKVKSLKYLQLHKIKDRLSSDDAILELYLNASDVTKRNVETFLLGIKQEVDFEIATMIEPFIKKIFSVKKDVEAYVDSLYAFIDHIKDLETRKEKAIRIVENYKQVGDTDTLFQLLDGRPLTKDHLKRIYERSLQR